MLPFASAFLILVELTEISLISSALICSTSKLYFSPNMIKSSIFAVLFFLQCYLIVEWKNLVAKPFLDEEKK